MLRPKVLELDATLDDVLAIARSARSASTGFRTVCVRERRRLGARIVAPLEDLDLDADAARVAPVVRDLVAAAARDIDTLLFGIFDAIDDGEGVFAGYHVAGLASHGRPIVEVLRDPWLPQRRFLESPSLDAIVSASRSAHRNVRVVVDHALRFAAAALIARFATIGSSHRLVVAFDEDATLTCPGALRYAEIGARPSKAPSTRGPRPLLSLAS
jgi:hypothetical protein